MFSEDESMREGSSGNNGNSHAISNISFNTPLYNFQISLTYGEM